MKQARSLHFLILIVILLLGVGIFYYVRPDRMLQMFVAIATAVAYVAWGIIHHVIEGDLHPRLVVEYILIALIAVVLLYTMAS